MLVYGEVNSPGIYTYKKGQRVRNLIIESGGLTNFAEKSSIFIEYPDGRSYKYNFPFNNHEVKDGSKLIVGKAEETEPFDKTEYIKELSSIVADFAQAISLLLIANN